MSLGDWISHIWLCRHDWKHLLAVKGSLGLQMDPRNCLPGCSTSSKVTVSSAGAQADCHRQWHSEQVPEQASWVTQWHSAVSALNLSVAGTVRRSGHLPRRGPGDEAGRSSLSENVVQWTICQLVHNDRVSSLLYPCISVSQLVVCFTHETCQHSM